MAMPPKRLRSQHSAHPITGVGRASTRYGSKTIARLFAADEYGGKTIDARSRLNFFDKSREESVGVMCWRRGSEISVGGEERRGIYSRRKKRFERSRGFARGHPPERWSVLQNCRDDVFVFFRLDRARRIHEPAAAREMCQRHLQHLRLLFARLRELFRTESPANFGMARERARAGARSVHQDSV